jgi:hypothetical protein
MKRIIALIYKSYVFRKIYTPYIKSLMTLIGGILILLSIFYGLFKVHFINPFTVSNKTSINLIVGALFICLLLIIFSLIFKKKDLDEYHFTEKQLKRVTIYIIIYFLTLILLLLGTLILRAEHIL